MTKSVKLEDEELGSPRSPRNAKAQRKTLEGLDLEPEEADEEYNDEYDESPAKAEDDDDAGKDDDNDDVDEDDDDMEPIKKRRGRKRKASTDEPERDDDKAEGEDHEAADGADAEEGEKSDAKKKPGKKRGRKPKAARVQESVLDNEGNEIEVKNDEVVMEEDPKGLEKIDENGFLKGDRKFRIKTFTLLGKGDRQYMVSTEPARLVGFRDSYLLFKTHLSLFKKVCTHDEKMDLISRQLIPTSYKGRSVNLVTARSIYREFGARMLIGGRKVIDDFFEDKARERGDVEGEYADPEEVSGKASYGAGDHNSFTAHVTGSALINYQADPTWEYQVAMQTLEFNKTLAEARNQVWLRGIKDTYSGFNFYPVASQPTKAIFTKVEDGGDDSALRCSIRLYNPNIRKTVTGLASVSKEIFDDIEDESIKEAILEQQRYERSL